MPNTKATKALQKRSDAALESFHRYYSHIWGHERWQNSLYPALCDPTRYCALLNMFADTTQFDAIAKNSDTYRLALPIEVFKKDSMQEDHETTGLHTLVRDNDIPFPAPRSISSSSYSSPLLSHWNLDYASALAASLLQVRPGDKVLDLCAAPGGKSIVLAQRLWPDLYHSAPVPANTTKTNDTALHANEIDPARNKRLSINLQSYLPQELFSSSTVKVLRLDGTKKTVLEELPLGVNGYDKVLVDAPCSSERHIIHAHLKAAMAGRISDEMSNWKSSHTKTLAKTQMALLLTALKAVKMNGIVLYATCSLSTEENDLVVERAIEAVKKQKGSEWTVQVLSDHNCEEDLLHIVEHSTEKTTHGRIALPDHASMGKWGPLYFSLLQKVAEKSMPPD